MLVAVVGLVVNIVSAFLLHHDHKHTGHNMRGVYLHVLADALTSVSAIIGLYVAMKWDLFFIDELVAIASSMLIIRRCVGQLKDSGKVLLDYSPTTKDKRENHNS